MLAADSLPREARHDHDSDPMTIRTRLLGRTGLAVSELGFGAWGIGGGLWGKPDDAAAKSALKKALQLGVTFFDTPLAQEHHIGIIARCPFDEGGLTGALREDTVFPSGDWRREYFKGERLRETVRRAEALNVLVAGGI